MDSRREFEEKFWEDVEFILTESFHHGAERAREGISAYKGDISGHSEEGGVPDAVYNQGEEKAAQIVDAKIRTGEPAVNL